MVTELAMLMSSAASEPQVAEPSPEPKPKKPRTLQREDSIGEFTRHMRAATKDAVTAETSSIFADQNLKDKIEAQVNDCFNTPPNSEESDPYEWWAKQKPDKVSFLLPLARRFFALPCSNGDVERLFSFTSRLADCLRVSMHPETAMRNALLHENMEVLGMWAPAP